MLPRHGSTWNGRACGSLSRAGAFGLYGNKTVTAGEGGMITTNDSELAAELRSLRGYCFGAERHFWHSDVGFSSRMSALQAALCLAQTRRLGELVAIRRRVAATYDALLDELAPGTIVRSHATSAMAGHSFWFYWVRISADRGRVREGMAGDGIETRPGFAPIHRQPCYTSGRWGSRTAPGGCIVADAVSREILLLPTHSHLTETTQRHIVESLVRHLS
jgi:perosamine synthetase